MIALSATKFNALREMARRKAPIWGMRPPIYPPAHPWQMEPVYADRQWWVRVRPGFVNGLAPLLPQLPDGEARKRVLPPAWEPESTLAIPTLVDEPAPLLPLTQWANAVTGENFPPGSKAGEPAMTIDIVLSVARVDIRYKAEILDPSGSTTGMITQTTTEAGHGFAASVGRRARLTSVAQYSPPEQPSMLDLLLGIDAEGEPEDRLHLATIYAVGDVDDHAGPGERARLWPRYFVHWNLSHASRIEAIKSQTQPITFNLPAGPGGILAALGNQVAATINSAADILRRALEHNATAGKFWNS